MKEEDINKLTNEQLIQIIKKYKICDLKKSIGRNEAISLVKNFLESKRCSTIFDGDGCRRG